MDRQDLDVELDLDVEIEDAADGGEAPPGVPEARDGGRRRSTDPTPALKNSHLLTFVVALFGALELQAIVVLMGPADAGMAETMTWAFGAIFMLSVFGWFVGGMLWFAKKFDQHR